MHFAIVNPQGGTVANVVEGDDITVVTEIAGPCVQVTEETGPARIGDLWTGTIFTTRPYPSWTWDGSDWVPPVPYPSTPGNWEWDEETQSWVDADN